MFTVTIGNDKYQFESGVRLEKLTKHYEGTFYAAKVNNRLRELSFVISTNSTVEFLDYSFYDSTRIYATSMRYLICMAFDRIYPNMQIKFSNSISMGIYGRPVEGSLSPEMVHRVIREMHEIIREDLPIVRKNASLAEMKKIYGAKNYIDKVKTLEYRKERVNVYECDGYLNYMYGYMVPSTKYLNEFELFYYSPGFLVRYPRIEEKGQIPEFSDSPSFLKVLSKAEQWAINCNADMIYKMNHLIEQNKSVQFVNMCETKHNNQLCELGDIISRDIESIRLIAIAGPSSSGKTTFSRRLEIELMTRGVKPLMISIDNYYLTPDQAPIDEFGEPDLEHVNALDLDLFNQNITDLINGDAVQLPLFDFKDKIRRFTDKIKINRKTPIIIEGIHALNDLLTEFIPSSQKFKIYISPFSQINIDYNNPINLTDLRLLRRIVRDLQFRNTSAEKTLAMWPSVRRGEYKWIYPFIESANYIYNSELTYELCVLKRYALNALKQIPYDSEYFIHANRLIKFLKYFKEINPYLVPCNSLLREFIGHSVFEH
ncbi:MAG: nucleoside kinase [Firmicutes bacterium]|nr:nucleoside kinase [Bacillota bacterium]